MVQSKIKPPLILPKLKKKPEPLAEETPVAFGNVRVRLDEEVSRVGWRAGMVSFSQRMRSIVGPGDDSQAKRFCRYVGWMQSGPVARGTVAVMDITMLAIQCVVWALTVGVSIVCYAAVAATLVLVEDAFSATRRVGQLASNCLVARRKPKATVVAKAA